MRYNNKHTQGIKEKELDFLLQACNYVNQVYPNPGVAVATPGKPKDGVLLVEVFFTDWQDFFLLVYHFGKFTAQKL